MIKFDKTHVTGWDAAIRGMRNPMCSWEKSDSTDFQIGPNDLKLMQRLVKAGPDHRKFMRMISVTVDITAPLYWWKEFDTYKVGTVANSCSTMHYIHRKSFSLYDFSYEHLDHESIQFLEAIIDHLNVNRESFNATDNKSYWWNIIQMLPSSYNQTRTIMLNYETIFNMYNARKSHKLDEWREGFTDWISQLPHSEELLINEKGE